MLTKTLAFTAVMSAVSFVLGALTFPFILGLNVHLFQVSVFICGAAGGPLPGLLCGLVAGSLTSLAKANPFILVGNGLLGLGVGLLSRRFRPAVAGMMSWSFIQAPWVYLTNGLILNFPPSVLYTLLGLLTLESVLAAVISDLVLTKVRIKSWLAGEATVGGTVQTQSLVLTGDLRLAVDRLTAGRMSIVFVKNSRVVFETDSRGISGYVRAIQSAKSVLAGSSIADTVMGRAAALLSLFIRVKDVYGVVMSYDAATLLKSKGVSFAYDRQVPMILNADSSDQCPFEKAVSDVSDPEEAFSRLVQKVEASGRRDPSRSL